MVGSMTAAMIGDVDLGFSLTEAGAYRAPFENARRVDQAQAWVGGASVETITLYGIDWW